MSDFLEQLWRFEYALVPCVVAYIVFDLPIIFRRLTRRIYVPIYFAFFPFGYSDELYARYLDEDQMYMVGGPLRKSEVHGVRLKIIFISVLSLVATMAISPFLSAMFSYFFLTDVQKNQFLYTLAAVKFLLLSWSLYELRWLYQVNRVAPFGFFVTLYVVYWIALLHLYQTSLEWIGSRVAEGGLPAIVHGLLDFFIFGIGVEVLLVVVFGIYIQRRLTNGTAKPLPDDEAVDE